MTSEAPDQDRVRLVRLIDAPRDQVFRAWTDPEQLRRWWGPGAFTCAEAEVDLRPGGHYRLVMAPTEGDAFVLGGTYREVEPPARLATRGGGRPVRRLTAPNRS